MCCLALIKRHEDATKRIADTLWPQNVLWFAQTLSCGSAKVGEPLEKLQLVLVYDVHEEVEIEGKAK